jgi:hypothetical protein
MRLLVIEHFKSPSAFDWSAVDVRAWEHEDAFAATTHDTRAVGDRPEPGTGKQAEELQRDVFQPVPGTSESTRLTGRRL